MHIKKHKGKKNEREETGYLPAPRILKVNYEGKI
jgi:hypothetical protein